MGERLAPTGLPVEDSVGALRDALRDVGTAVLVAEPGAGKTTVVPLRLLDQAWGAGGRIVVLQPRRVAARAAAARMAALIGEQVGATVGYATRDDRRSGPATRIEVVTEGILTRRLQSDPSLPGVAMVVFDELHERHLQTDLGLALIVDARTALRPDLRLLAMSATIDAGPVARLIGGAPVIASEGRTFPVTVRWVGARSDGRLGRNVAAVVRDALAGDRGDVLVFLPGVGEIRAVTEALGSVPGTDVVPLYGSLPAAEQDRALRTGPRRRVVLATDLAESSVTVEGVGVVVDCGLARRPYFDQSSGLTRLRTVVASRASADQRAGRAGRTGPGVAYRLWSQSDHLARRPWPDPEIVTADLAGLALELTVWGAKPESLRWLDQPPPAAVARARTLLEDLGATDDGRPTPLGRRMAALPLHPRLAAMLLAAPPADHRTAGFLAALLSERDVLRSDAGPVTADVAIRLSVLRGQGVAGERVDAAAVSLVRRRAAQLTRRAATSDDGGPGDAGPLLAVAYPDRIAQSRGGNRYRLRHGGGAVLDEHDPLAGTAWLVAADVDGAGSGSLRPGADGRIRLAAALDRTDVEHLLGRRLETIVRLEWDGALDDLRAVRERRIDALLLDTSRGPASPGADTVAALLTRACETGLAVLGWTPASRALQQRAGWARRTLGEDWPDVSDEALAATATEWLAPLLSDATGRGDLARVDPGVAIRAALGRLAHLLDRLAPTSLLLSRGRRVNVDYSGDTPHVSARAQDFYGLTVHPTVADGRIAVTVELLSPAGRPIQVTADIPALWQGSWQQIRKDMAGRYPKHSWPVDPGAGAAAPGDDGSRRGRR